MSASGPDRPERAGAEADQESSRQRDDHRMKRRGQVVLPVEAVRAPVKIDGGSHRPLGPADPHPMSPDGGREVVDLPAGLPEATAPVGILPEEEEPLIQASHLLVGRSAHEEAGPRDPVHLQRGVPHMAEIRSSRRLTGLFGNRRVKGASRPKSPVQGDGSRRADPWTVPSGFSSRGPTTAASGCSFMKSTSSEIVLGCSIASGFSSSISSPTARSRPGSRRGQIHGSPRSAGS